MKLAVPQAMPVRVSLSDLSAAGVRLRAAEAAAIVVEICKQITEGRLRGVPSLNVIRLTEDGGIVAEGPIGAGRATVARASVLLDDLLPDHAPTAEYRTPGGLRLVLVRAQGSLDLPPFSGLSEFCASLSRFAAPDLSVVVHELLELWSIARRAEDAASRTVAADRGSAGVPAVVGADESTITISDVRRARRATGLSLDDVAERSRIPAALLRELEWGYLRNWPGGLYGRSQLVRYARAAGLDDRVVVQAAWPLLVDAVELRGSDAVEAIPAEQPIDAIVTEVVSDAGDAAIVEADLVEEPADVNTLRALPFPVQPAPRRRRGVAVLAAAAVIAIAIVPAAWEYSERSRTPQPDVRPVQTAAVPAAAPTSSPAPAHQERTPAAPRVLRRPDRVVERAVSSPPQRIVEQDASYSPTFSNEGTAMFFHEESAGRSDLMRADTDARGTILKITRIVDDNAQNFHARPSPDGTKLAFDSDREGTRAVFIADSDGRHVRRVSGDGFAAVPSWSPDGQQLAFVKAEPDDGRVWNLWLADLRTGDLRRLTSSRVGQPWGASWFPDGRHVAFSHETDLIVLDLATDARKVYHTPLVGHLVRTPAVSPDGHRIIFQVHRDGGWLLDLKNGSMRRVLDDPSAEEYTWAPDGHRVAFHSHRAGGWGVWVMGQ